MLTAGDEHRRNRKGGAPGQPSDEELIARFRGEPDSEDGRRAVGALLARYQDRVYAWCIRVIRDHELALDVSQAVLIKAWRSLPQFDERSKFSSWLFVIARNESLTALRPRLLRRDPDASPEWFLVDHDHPAAILESREAEETMERLLRDTLSPLEQDAIWLRCFENLRVEDITRMLKIQNVSGARGVLQNAREKLRRALARRRDPA